MKQAIDETLFTNPAPVAGKRKVWILWSALLIVTVVAGLVWFGTQTGVEREAIAGNEANKETSEMSLTSEETATGSEASGAASSVGKSDNSSQENNAQSGEDLTAMPGENVTNTVSSTGAGENSYPPRYYGEEAGAMEGTTAHVTHRTDEENQPVNQVSGGTVTSGSGNNENDGQKPVNNTSMNSMNVAGNSSSGSETPGSSNTGEVVSGETASEASGQESITMEPVNELATRAAVSIDADIEKTLQESAISFVPPKGKGNKLSLATYAGTSFGMNSMSSIGNKDLSIDEQAGVYASLEVYYPIGRRLALSGGVDYMQRKDRLVEKTLQYDSVFTGNQTVLVYDTSMQVIDTLYNPVYEQLTNTIESVGYVRNFSIGVPLYLHYTVPLGQRFMLDAGLGVRMSYMKYTTDEIVPNITYPDTYKQFGLNVSLRPEFIYSINRLGVGLYGRFEYDALHGMEWNNVKRTRWSAGLGLSLRYKL